MPGVLIITCPSCCGACLLTVTIDDFIPIECFGPIDVGGDLRYVNWGGFGETIITSGSCTSPWVIGFSDDGRFGPLYAVQADCNAGLPTLESLLGFACTFTLTLSLGVYTLVAVYDGITIYQASGADLSPAASVLTATLGLGEAEVTGP